MSVAIAAIWSNLRYVSAVRDDLVYIREDALQISRPQKKIFLNAFAKYLGGVG